MNVPLTLLYSTNNEGYLLEFGLNKLFINLPDSFTYIIYLLGYHRFLDFGLFMESIELITNVNKKSRTYKDILIFKKVIITLQFFFV